MCGCKYKENFNLLYNPAATNSFFSIHFE
jgi:hypothetical protein